MDQANTVTVKENPSHDQGKRLQDHCSPVGGGHHSEIKGGIFSSPNNPCGAIYSKEDLAAIAAVVAKHPNLYIISDEIYELLNYGEVKHVSIASSEVYIKPSR